MAVTIARETILTGTRRRPTMTCVNDGRNNRIIIAQLKQNEKLQQRAGDHRCRLKSTLEAVHCLSILKENKEYTASPPLKARAM